MSITRSFRGRFFVEFREYIPFKQLLAMVELAYYFAKQLLRSFSAWRHGFHIFVLNGWRNNSTLAGSSSRYPEIANATFAPAILPERECRLGGVEDMILSLYARGMSTKCVLRLIPCTEPAIAVRVVSSEYVVTVKYFDAAAVRTKEHRTQRQREG
jgi:hypothetical protein